MRLNLFYESQDKEKNQDEIDKIQIYPFFSIIDTVIKYKFWFFFYFVTLCRFVSFKLIFRTSQMIEYDGVSNLEDVWVLFYGSLPIL